MIVSESPPTSSKSTDIGDFNHVKNEETWARLVKLFGMLGVGNTTGETATETGYSREILVIIRTKETLQLGQHSTTQR